MKFFLIFLAIVAFTAAAKTYTKEEENQIIDDYFQKFNPRAGRSADFEKRKKNVLKKSKEIEEHNERFKRGEETFSESLNEFSQLDDEELKSFGGFELPQGYVSHGNQTLPPPIKDERRGRAAIPTNWNWATDTQVVHPVQSQGSCGSCYAFAAIGALEGSMCRYHKQCTKLSEMEAMECTNGCNNGWDEWVYNYAKDKFGGTAYASNYGYTPYTRSSCAAHGARVPKSKVFSYVVHNDDPEAIKTFVYQYGPISAAFELYSSLYNYKSGIYSGCSGTKVGAHAALITGYGESNGVKYWILKNSWGTSWGEKGYFKMRQGYCKIENYKLSFPWTE